MEETSVETIIEPPLATFNIDDYSSESFTSEEVDQLLKSIQEENDIDILYHKEIYTNNEEDILPVEINWKKPEGQLKAAVFSYAVLSQINVTGGFLYSYLVNIG